ASTSFTLTVTAVNDPPTFTLAAGPTSLEDAGPQTVANFATNISAGPPDESGQTLTGFTLTANGTTGGLTFSSAPAISLSGTLTYTAAANSNGTATFSVTLADNGSNTPPNSNTSAPQSFTITVTAVNDAPTIAAPANLTTLEDTPLNITSISVADVDAGSASEQVTLGVLDGTIRINTTTGLTIVGNNSASVTMTGTIANLNAGLNGLTYTPGLNFNDTRGSEVLSVGINDQGNTGSGGALTASATVPISVTPVNDAPSALPKTFSAQANMKITGLTGLLTGATDPDAGDGGFTSTLIVGPTIGATSPPGGVITTLNQNTGTFDFEPPAGVTGPVTFTYTVCDNGNPPTTSLCSAPATVTINVAGPVIWFVDPSAATNGDGRLDRPFNTLASVPAVDTSGQRIFVYTGNAGSGITLNSDEWLIGQGVTGTTFDSVFGITPPAGTIARPSINGTRPTVPGNVVMATSDSVRGLNITPASGTQGLTASTANSLNVGEVSVTTTNAIAVNLTNSDGAFSFTSISANGGSDGIVWNNSSAASGSFTITGSGGTCTNTTTTGCTGGTISNMTGADDSSVAPVGTGIALNNASNVSLTRMFIHDHSNYGIRGFGVTGFTLANSVINGTNGTNDATPFNDSSVYFNNNSGVALQGTASISNTFISGGFTNNFWVLNNAGTLNSTFDTVNIGANSTTGGNKGIMVEGLGSATINVTVRNSTFTSSRGDLFGMQADGSGGGNLDFDSNTLSNNHPAIATGGGGVTLIGGAAAGGTFHFNIHGTNTFRDAVGHALNIVKDIGAGSANGTVTGAQIGVVGVTDSGSKAGSGLNFLDEGGGGSMTVAATNNRITQYNNDGISIVVGGGVISGGNFNATITGNTIGPLGSDTIQFPGVGIRLTSGVTPGTPGDSFTTCAQLGGAGVLHNTLTNSGISGASADYRVRQRFNTTVQLPGYSGAAGDLTAVVNFIDSNNTVTQSPGGTASADFTNTPSTGGGFVNSPGGAACTQPSP
ncbi:MAG: cadherin-like domain-containing protein, partial [Mycobacterium sp.]|nr:cadherin-like domain-containing protein [Mycobacterium sp.]